MNDGPASNAKWLYDNPIYSDVEAKLRRFLVDLGNTDRIVGIQVCAYKDGQVIIDTAAGVLGKDDPRPVQPDSLFPVFSATKGVTAGMVHWLADKGKLKLDDNVVNIWPEFGTNGKDQTKVNHILNHTSGLHNALADIIEDHASIGDWNGCLKRIATLAPETEPGSQQLYHYLSYGWLCGGIIEHASGKKFQEILEESFVHPLNVEGELYIGISPGVESRLATLTVDTDDFSKVDPTSNLAFIPSSLTTNMISILIALIDTLDGRRAILPAANGNFSARAVARYYAALVDGGVVPPPHPNTSLPPLGSHPHHPINPKDGNNEDTSGEVETKIFTSPKEKLHDANPKDENNEDTSVEVETKILTSPVEKLHDANPKDWNNEDTSCEMETKIFTSPKEKLHDAFMGRGDYENVTFPDGKKFGLGFCRHHMADGSLLGFGHAGLGGSTAYCDINNRFAISVTLNKLNTGALTGEIIRFICAELDLPVPVDYAASTNTKPVIN